MILNTASREVVHRALIPLKRYKSIRKEPIDNVDSIGGAGEVS
jgi:hypothetical protein